MFPLDGLFMNFVTMVLCVDVSLLSDLFTWAACMAGGCDFHQKFWSGIISKDKEINYMRRVFKSHTFHIQVICAHQNGFTPPLILILHSHRLETKVWVGSMLYLAVLKE